MSPRAPEMHPANLLFSGDKPLCDSLLISLITKTKGSHYVAQDGYTATELLLSGEIKDCATLGAVLLGVMFHMCNPLEVEAGGLL